MSTAMTYEQSLQRLSEIVHLLEHGSLSLDDSLALFEEGTKLSAFCYKKLNTAQQKITKLTTGKEDSDD